MIHRCDKPCGNKTANGYCQTTACIDPRYSNFGTVQYGQGVQKRIITNADRIRAMSDEELAERFSLWCCRSTTDDSFCKSYGTCDKCWLDWLRQEANLNEGSDNLNA